MSRLPDWLREVLTLQAARQWRTTAGGLAPGLVVHGGAALTAQLRHRVSGDLRLVDATTARLLRPPVWIAGLPLTSTDDLMVGLLHRLRHRDESTGEPLDLLVDLAAVEERAGLPVEEGLLLYRHRHDTDTDGLARLVERLHDSAGPVGEPEPSLAAARAYWRRRCPEILAALSTRGFVARQHQTGRSAVSERQSALRTRAAVVYVTPHERDGQPIEGYWRRR